VKLSVVTIEAKDGGDVAQADKADNGVIPAIKIPAVSPNVTLPWFTGKPYALYAHVRAVTTHGSTRWSRPFGFNMRWEDAPVPQPARPGLVRWRPIEGATAYDVWYPDIRRSFRTRTNVADERELYTFHDDPDWWSTVRWRVRAVREVLGSIPNGLPAVSYGPWSPVYAATNPDLSRGKIELRQATSDVVTNQWTDAAHQLMPAFTFTGNQDLSGREWPLFRVYVSTDRDCVNVVFRGSVTGGPAFAPRVTGPLKLPTSFDEIDALQLSALGSGSSEGTKTFSADGFAVTASETLPDDSSEPRVDLPDVDAKTTRYFWTVVPVAIDLGAEGSFTYVDVELPQDACEAGRIGTFAKRSRPAITASHGAFVSGLTPKGRLLATAGRRPVVYSTPLVAWRPVLAATAYRVEWSRTKYPWRQRGSIATRSTAAVLNLKPGLWYYRIRGLNPSQVGTSAMTWSSPVAIRVVRPTFKIASR
jgi:hypothetical protein